MSSSSPSMDQTRSNSHWFTLHTCSNQLSQLFDISAVSCSSRHPREQSKPSPGSRFGDRFRSPTSLLRQAPWWRCPRSQLPWPQGVSTDCSDDLGNNMEDEKKEPIEIIERSKLWLPHVTLPKTNMDPHNGPLEDGFPLPTSGFGVPC